MNTNLLSLEEKLIDYPSLPKIRRILELCLTMFPNNRCDIATEVVHAVTRKTARKPRPLGRG